MSGPSVQRRAPIRDPNVVSPAATDPTFERIVEQALGHGNPLVMVRAGLITHLDLLFKLPPTDINPRHAAVYHEITHHLPLSEQFHPTNGKHFLVTHTDRKYAIVAHRHLRTSSDMEMHSDLRNVDSSTVSVLIISRMVQDVPSDPFMAKFTLSTILPTLSNELDSEALEWMTFGVNIPSGNISLTPQQLPRWIAAVIATDNYAVLPRITMIKADGTWDQHFGGHHLVQGLVRPLLARWLTLQNTAPDYRKLLIGSSGPLLIYIKNSNGFHSVSDSEVDLLRSVVPSLLQKDWNSISPMQRGLSSLTHAALWKFAGLSQSHNHAHGKLYAKVIRGLAAADPEYWFKKYHSVVQIDSKEFMEDIISCNEENILGHRVDSYSKNDYVVSINKAGTHYHYFTREEYPTLVKTGKNFYTKEPILPYIIAKLSRTLESSEKSLLLPARPWMENWTALRDGEWIPLCNHETEKLWKSLQSKMSKCDNCGEVHPASVSHVHQTPVRQQRPITLAGSSGQQLSAGVLGMSRSTVLGGYNDMWEHVSRSLSRSLMEANSANVGPQVSMTAFAAALATRPATAPIPIPATTQYPVYPVYPVDSSVVNRDHESSDDETDEESGAGSDIDTGSNSANTSDDEDQEDLSDPDSHALEEVD